CLGEVRFEGAEVAPPRTVLATVTASSELEPVAAYRSQYLFDSRLDFGWVEGAKDLGVGEWVQAELGRPVEVHALELWNGYQRSEDHFQKNARAKRIAIVTDGGRVEVDVPDTMGPSKLPLPAPVTTGKIRIEILEATPGTKYSDLVLTEARVWDGEGPLAFTTPMKQMAFGVLTRARGTHLERMIDYLLVSTCSPNKQLKIRSNSSFVWWVTNAEVSEVFDGAWVFRDSDAKGTGIQLYGRRHRTTEDWSPYGSGGVEETVRVAGGKPVFTRASQVDAATWDKGMAAVQKAYDEPCEMSWAEAKEKDAILVVGDAFTDVLVKDPSRG
ncbi:MAG: discoidin domain-containing protein, partial [Myxococcales bacterium]|nr:discoidin domain-containing protein [Myxococcales bacterium]